MVVTSTQWLGAFILQHEAGGNATDNLISPLTPLIGRQMELAEIYRLLGCTRLLTLTGPAGCGKTRLALETARVFAYSEAGPFEDGVWMVDLAQVQDPRLVSQAIVDSLRLSTPDGQGLADLILDYLRPRSLLLVLDNCEHLVEEAARFVSLALREAPNLHILATSQAPLDLTGEIEWLVPSLALPEEGEEPQDPARWLEYAAVQLFENRAAAARADFSFSREKAHDILKICRALDGIPLAIELAAARVKLLSVAEIAARLDQRLALLINTKRDVLLRHQTLSAALDWSYALLEPEEQRLLDRLSIFTGPWTIEAAAAVCAEDTVPVFDLVSRLVDRSLVASSQAVDGTRYRLLESVRLFGLSHLSAAEQAERHDRLLAWFDGCTARECPQAHGARQLVVVRWMRADLPNLIAAVQWAETHAVPDPRRLQGLRIAASSSWVMRIIGRAQTSIEWLEKLLDGTDMLETEDWLAARAEAHVALSRQYWYTSVYSLGRKQALAALELFARMEQAGLCKAGDAAYLNARQMRLLNDEELARAQFIPLYLDLLAGYQAVNDRRGVIETCIHVALTYMAQEQFEPARSYFKRALHLARDEKNLQFHGLAARDYAWALIAQDRWTEAFSLMDEAYRCFDTLGFVHGMSYTLVDLGDAALKRGMLDQADAYYRQSIPYADRSGTLQMHQYAVYKLGVVALHQGQEQAAETWFHKVFSDFPGLEQPDLISAALCGVAAIRATAAPALAARLAGHAYALYSIQHDPKLLDQSVVLPSLSTLREALGEREFTRCAAQGAQMSIREILQDGALPVLSGEDRIPARGTGQKQTTGKMTPRQIEKARFSGLTSREREVAILIARGFSNLAIAGHMMIGGRTVTTHVTHILEKLGYSSRTQIAAWAVEKGLVRVT